MRTSLPRLHGPHGDVGVQPGGQADVHQVHRGIGDHRVQVGAGGEPELVADLRQLLRCPAEDDHLVDVRARGVDRGMGLTKTGAQQRDLHGIDSSRSGGTRECLATDHVMEPEGSTATLSGWYDTSDFTCAGVAVRVCGP